MLRTELVGALARFGDIARAKAEVAEIRRLNPQYLPELTACALLAEGLTLHFDVLSTGAVRTFRAAEAVARSAARNDIAAMALAWVAASEFLNGEIAVAAKHAVRSIRDASASAYGTIARAELVIADSLSSAGLLEQANSHYQSARNAAVSMGDISMQSTVLFNRAAFAVAQQSIADIEGTSDAQGARAAELLVQSVESLDRVVGLDSLSSLVPLLRAELAIAGARWIEALRLFDVGLESAEEHGQSRWMAKFLSEKSLGYAMTGALDQATTTARAALDCIGRCVDMDDLAIAHMRLAATYEVARVPIEASKHRSTGRMYLDSFHNAQHHLQVELRTILLDLGS
jgi:tetratricopeptide (TPR) repeat protein